MVMLGSHALKLRVQALRFVLGLGGCPSNQRLNRLRIFTSHRLSPGPAPLSSEAEVDVVPDGAAHPHRRSTQAWDLQSWEPQNNFHPVSSPGLRGQVDARLQDLKTAVEGVSGLVLLQCCLGSLCVQVRNTGPEKFDSCNSQDTHFSQSCEPGRERIKPNLQGT